MADSNYRTENRQREVSEPGSNKENLEEQLVEQIKPLPPKSKKRRKLINDLVKMIQPELIKKSRKVVGVTKENELFVEDALQNTYINIQKYLKSYNPEKSSFMNWVITSYKREFYKLSKKRRKAGLTNVSQNSTSEKENNLEVISIDAANYDVPISDETNAVCGDSFDELIEQNAQKWLENIKEFIETDPEESLQKIVIRSKTTGKQLTLQTALLMKLQDRTLKEISDATGVPLKLISSCIHRNMATVKKYITDHTAILFKK